MATIQIDAQVENIDEVIATYNQLKLYRDTDPSGAFSTLVDTEALVAGQTDYTLTDTSGSSAYVYRYLFHDSVGAVSSSLSPAFFPTGRLAADILLEAAKKTRGFVGACTDAGTSSTLIDSYLAENAEDEDYLDGAYVFRPDAAAESDWQRRTARNPFSAAGPSLTVVVPWTNAPADAERYGAFTLLPPLPGRGGYSYMEALSDGLAALTVSDVINLGPGDADGHSNFSLNPHVGYIDRRSIRKVVLRRYWDTTDLTLYDDEDASKNQRWVEYVENTRDDVALRLQPPPSTDEYVFVHLDRRFERLYRPDDLTLCPFELAVWACVAKVYEHMQLVSGGKFGGEAAHAVRALNAERNFTRPLQAVRS